MSRDLLIVLRTCTRVNMLNGEQMGGRYVKVPKHQLVNVCMSSLVNSINQVQGHSVKLVVLDDHSSLEAVADFKTILANCHYPTEFISIEDGTGPNHTCFKVYDQVELHATDLWYHIEDDYLHVPEAIQDMIDSVDQFESNTGQLVAVNPHDDIWRYTNEIYESIILMGPCRHYRTVRHSTYSCLASRRMYDKYRDYFQDAAKYLMIRDENSTINRLWNQPDVMLFAPIPTLALHISVEGTRDPYIDFDALWDSVPRLWLPKNIYNIAIISMYNEVHQDLGKETWPNKVAYADLHGYQSYVKTDGWTKTPIHFEKLVHMLDVMDKNPELDWVWWLDNDAIITNYDRKVEDLLDDDAHVIITVDHASLNAGSFMVRNSQQGRGWLNHILSLESHYKDNRWPEQQPMTDTYISFKDIIKVLPQRSMNSYDYKMYGVPGIDLTWQSGQWEPGDFVLHVPALPNPTRIAISKQLSPHHKREIDR